MTTQKKEDRRVKYTKKAIKDSFLSLFESKPLEKISVTEICTNADINRGTFYSHYSDPYDLKEKLEAEFIEAIKARICTCTDNHNSRMSTVCTFRMLKDNRELCRVFTGPNGDFRQLIHIVGSQYPSYLGDVHAALRQYSPENANCLQPMMVSCITSVIKYWFDNGMLEEPEVIAEALDEFILSGLKAFIPVDEIISGGTI